MRTIKRIILHCTASPQTQTVQEILNYWKYHNGWNDPGYHFLIEADGTVHNLLPVEKVSNGARGYNSTSIHISYIGGVDENKQPIDNRTDAQIQSMIVLVARLKLTFVDALVIGHRDLTNVKKKCPSFDARDWLKSIYFPNYY